MERDAKPTTVLDCDEGRRLGCATFCCRLIVRLDPDDVQLDPEGRRKNCVDKDPVDGLCVHLDRETMRCSIWERRPRVCRAYNCNEDPQLQVVLRDGFKSLRVLVTTPLPPARATVPKKE